MRSTLATAAGVSRRAATAFWSCSSRSARIKRCSASSAGKPRSRKTLPVDCVTLILLLLGIGLSLPHEGTEAIAGEVHIALGCLARALLERVEHVQPHPRTSPRKTRGV